MTSPPPKRLRLRNSGIRCQVRRRLLPMRGRLSHARPRQSLRPNSPMLTLNSPNPTLIRGSGAANSVLPVRPHRRRSPLGPCSRRRDPITLSPAPGTPADLVTDRRATFPVYGAAPAGYAAGYGPADQSVRGGTWWARWTRWFWRPRWAGIPRPWRTAGPLWSTLEHEEGSRVAVGARGHRTRSGARNRWLYRLGLDPRR